MASVTTSNSFPIGTPPRPKRYSGLKIACARLLVPDDIAGPFCIRGECNQYARAGAGQAHARQDGRSSATAFVPVAAQQAVEGGIGRHAIDDPALWHIAFLP